MNVGCRRKRGTGFTLVELLVVLVVISVLASLLLPALALAKFQALDAVCTNNMGQQIAVGTAFADDNRGKFPRNKSAFESYPQTKRGYIQWMNVGNVTQTASLRPHTSFGAPKLSHPGSVWLFTDYVYMTTSGGLRYWGSHDYAPNNFTPRYRVGHLDGHVDLHERHTSKYWIWDSYNTTTSLQDAWIDTEKDAL